MKERNNLNFSRRRLGHHLSRTLQESRGAAPFRFGNRLWASLRNVCASSFTRVVKPRLGRLPKLKLSHSHPDPASAMVLFRAGG